MATSTAKSTRCFFSKGTVPEWEFVLSLYQDALKLKAQQRKKPEELIKLDNWYQNELPKIIQSRKEKHVTHDEMVQIMKWKLTRGKFVPQMINLVKMNTPLVIQQSSKKAFKKMPKLQSAVSALGNLKGVGPAMASAVLVACSPDHAAFMADECMMAIPDVESIDYTTQEYLNFSHQLQEAANRLNAATTDLNSTTHVKWTPHKVELAVWTHSILNEFNPSLLDQMPSASGASNGRGVKPADSDDSTSCEPKLEENGNGQDHSLPIHNGQGIITEGEPVSLTATETEASNDSVCTTTDTSSVGATTENGNLASAEDSNSQSKAVSSIISENDDSSNSCLKLTNGDAVHDYEGSDEPIAKRAKVVAEGQAV